MSAKASVREGQVWKDNDRRSYFKYFTIERLEERHGETSAHVAYHVEPVRHGWIKARRLQAGGYHGGAYSLVEDARDAEFTALQVEKIMDELADAQGRLRDEGAWEDVVEEIGEAIQHLHIARDMLRAPDEEDR